MSDREATIIAGWAALITIMIGGVFITYRPMGWVLLAAAIVFVITGVIFSDDSGVGDG